MTLSFRPEPRFWIRPLVWGFLSVASAVLAVVISGRIHPDELYQYLEPAFFHVRGYGLLAWEWSPANALRNWAFPLLLASFLRISDGFGFTHPQIARAWMALPQVLFHALSLAAIWRYARTRVGTAGADAAALLWGLQGVVLLYAGRTLGESLSAAFLVLAVESLSRDDADETPWAGVMGGLALGLAGVARYGSGPFIVASVLWLALQRRWQTLTFTLLSGSGVLVGLAWLDEATWGTPLISLVNYVQFNVVSGGAARYFGESPWTFYLLPLVSMTPLWTWPAALMALRRKHGASLPVLASVLYLAVLFVTPHKEERFLYPAVVLLSLAAAPLAGAWCAGLWHSAGPRFFRFGIPALFGLASLAYVFVWPDLRGDEFRATTLATRDADASGLLLVGEGVWGAGGYFTLGKPLPWATSDGAHDETFRNALGNPAINRAITFGGISLRELEAAGFRVTGKIGRETMLAR